MAPAFDARLLVLAFAEPPSAAAAPPKASVIDAVAGWARGGAADAPGNVLFISDSYSKSCSVFLFSVTAGKVTSLKLNPATSYVYSSCPVLAKRD